VEKRYHQIWEANLQPLRPNKKPKYAQSWLQVFSALSPGVKWGLWSHKSLQNDPKRVSPNWLNVAGCDVFLSTEGAKVSNLFDIGQHNKYFINYRNQNKSSQKVGVAGWRRRQHSPTGVSWC